MEQTEPTVRVRDRVAAYEAAILDETQPPMAQKEKMQENVRKSLCRAAFQKRLKILKQRAVRG